MGKATMTLEDLLHDIYALEDELRVYERKYGVLSQTFYQSYAAGEEPPRDEWVRDWATWASAYKLRERFYRQHQTTIEALRAQVPSTADMIEKTARHEPIPVAA